MNDPGQKKMDEIWARVENYVGAGCEVIYSVYKNDADDLPVDNLDEIAIPGRVIMRRPRSTAWGGEESRDWESPLLDDPTWLDLCPLVNDSIKASNDHTHIFFEGVVIDEQEGDIKFASFSLGS